MPSFFSTPESAEVGYVGEERVGSSVIPDVGGGEEDEVGWGAIGWDADALDRDAWWSRCG